MKANISKIGACILGLYLFLHSEICLFLEFPEHNVWEEKEPSQLQKEMQFNNLKKIIFKNLCQLRYYTLESIVAVFSFFPRAERFL